MKRPSERVLGLCFPLQRTVAATCFTVWASIVSAQEQMELHLVLAFDVSASVNDVEFNLQRKGTAAALRTPLVAEAIEQAHGGVAIAIVQWSSATQQALGLDWVELHDAADIAAFAKDVADMPRRLPGGNTMIHSGLEFASRMLEAAPGQARRRVIDIAANGRADDAEKLAVTRARLLSEGVVINGIAIEEDFHFVSDYFIQYVIGGPGAFVVTANDFDDFGEAMERKLFREISSPRLSMHMEETSQ